MDMLEHRVNVGSLPVNYAVLSGLPMNIKPAKEAPKKTKFCEAHNDQKVNFFCKSDLELFCFKCVLKHTDAKHEVIQVENEEVKYRPKNDRKALVKDIPHSLQQQS